MSHTDGGFVSAGTGEPPHAIRPDHPVRLIMTTSLAVLDPDDTVLQAAEELAGNEIGCALVGHEGTDGLISERDIVALLSQRTDTTDTRIADVQTVDLVWATPATTISDVGTMMLQADVRHIPVRDGDRAVGMVSIRDVLAVYLASTAG